MVAALGVEKPAAKPRTVRRNPYKGLEAFHETDAADFYGRDRIVEELVAGVGAARLLAVVGPSGSGKSSLVRAGLLPALRRGALSGSELWLAMHMKPGADPFEEFTNALASIAVDTSPPDRGSHRYQYHHELVRAVQRAVQDQLHIGFRQQIYPLSAKPKAFGS